MQFTRFATALAGAVLFAAPVAAQEAAPAVEAGVEVDAEPAPPEHASADYPLPPREADGEWRTPNRGIGKPEAAWHLRVALNVAALGCRGAEEARTVAGYNALLADRRDPLAAAALASEEAFRARHGEAWRAAHDDAMTRLYNFWAQPPVQAAFCREARAVLAEQATVEPSNFAAWTAASLRRLETPFTAFYAAFDEYRVRLTAYRARHAAPIVLAAAGPVGASASMPAPPPAAPVVLAAAVGAPVEIAAARPAVLFPAP